MEFICTTKHFAVPVSDEIWQGLVKIDEELLDYDIEGAFDIEWNGHFGQLFFFCCHPQDERKVKTKVAKFLNSLTKSSK